MEQCKVSNQDVFIYGLEDAYDYIRKFVNDDFADAVEDIIRGKLSDKDDKIYDLEIEIDERIVRGAHGQHEREHKNTSRENRLHALERRLLRVVVQPRAAG